MKTFSTRKQNLLPTFIIWATFYSLLIFLLFGLANSSTLGIFILIIPSIWIFYVVLNWFLKSVVELEIIINENGLEVRGVNGESQKITWNDIQGLNFYSTGGGLTIIVGPLSKYLGYYGLDTNKGLIDLPPSLNNLDFLLKLVIEKAHLKKYSPTFEQSWKVGGIMPQLGPGQFAQWRKENNYQPSEQDLNTNAAGISKSAIQLFFVLVLGVIFVFFLLKFLKDNNLI